MLCSINSRGEIPRPFRPENLPSRRDILRAAAGGVATLIASSLPAGCVEFPAPTYQAGEWYLTLDDGTQVFVKDLLPSSGAAPKATVIFAHGFNSCGEEWSTFIPNANVRILAFDAPAHGNSEPYRTGTHSPERNAAIVDELLAAADPGLPRMLIGYSMGGMTMAAYAAQYPDFDGEIVMINSHASPLDTSLVEVGLDLLSRPNPDLPTRQALLEYVGGIKNLDLLAALPESKADWLIVGSRRDAIIPFESVRLLAAVLGDRAAFLELSGNHLPILWDMQRLQSAISEDLARLGAGD